MYHIGIDASDLGPEPPRIALLCGDPQRARRLACETDGVSCERVLSEHRGLNSYLCRSAGRFIAATSGMGAPAVSIVANELFQVGVRTIIRVGSCGAIQEHIRPGAVVIASAALCRQGAADDIAPAEFPAAADPFLCTALARAARELEVDWHLGLLASVDTFYEGQERIASSANPYLLPHLQGLIEQYRRLNLLAFEMEAGTLFKMGSVYGFAAGCICAVFAARTRAEGVAPEHLQAAEKNAIQVALRTVDALAD